MIRRILAQFGEGKARKARISNETCGCGWRSATLRVGLLLHQLVKFGSFRRDSQQPHVYMSLLACFFGLFLALLLD
jgi:hypothetical protein